MINTFLCFLGGGEPLHYHLTYFPSKTYNKIAHKLIFVLKNGYFFLSIINQYFVQMPAMKRLINRKQQKQRPRCPTSLDDPLQLEHIPDGFLVADVRSPDDKARHHVFASKPQINILAKCTVLYVDGTFEVSIFIISPSLDIVSLGTN